MKAHQDSWYVSEKYIKGNGAGYEYSGNDKPIHLLFICGKNKLQIFIYNIMIFVRFYWRKYARNKNRR